MKLSTLFQRCLRANYLHLPGGSDYALERVGTHLYVYLEQSRGEEDWRSNLDFPAIPYGRGQDTVWFAHRGFVKGWKEVETAISPALLDPSLQKVTVVGYSHGAALAVLCHEFIWFHRPDLRCPLQGFGFGSPRVIWGILPQEVGKRWEGFTVIRNLDDLVTHMPPTLLGYTHVGQLLEIGARGRYSKTDAHRPEHLLTELVAYEQAKEKTTQTKR